MKLQRLETKKARKCGCRRWTCTAVPSVVSEIITSSVSAAILKFRLPVTYGIACAVIPSESRTRNVGARAGIYLLTSELHRVILDCPP